MNRKQYDLMGCTDCVLFLANGDLPDDNPDGWSPKAIERSWPSKTYQLFVGGDENTETEFSWRGCDVCGSRLAGDRYPVVAWCDDTAD